MGKTTSVYEVAGRFRGHGLLDCWP